MSLRALPSDRSPVRHRILVLLAVVALLVGQGLTGSASAFAAGTATAAGTSQPTATAGPATASGQVTAADGSGPVTGVVVKAIPHGSAGFTPVTTATTGSTGSWTMSDLPPGSYDLQFDATDTAYLSQWWSAAATRDGAGILSASAGSTLNGLDASLTRGATVSGRVVDAAGKPLPNVLVTPREQAGGDVTGSSVTTAADGTFTVRGLAAGTYTLTFRSAGRVAWSYGMKAATDAPTFFAVGKGASVTGRAMVLPAGSAPATRSLLAAAVDTTATMSGHVYAGSTSTPLAGALVVAVAADSDPISTGGTLTATTDALGAWTLAGLPADVYTVHVLPPVASAYTEQWWDGSQQRSRAAYAVLTAGSSRAGMDATLVLAGSISGRATTPDGVFGVADVVVAAAPVGTDTWSSVTTDIDGNFTIGGLAPGAYDLSFDGQSLGFQTTWWSSTSASGVPTRDAGTPVPVNAAETVTGRNVQMTQAGSIFGTVTDESGAPVPDATVDVTPADNGTGSGFATTDIGGNFNAQGLPAGSYRVRVMPAAGSPLATQWFDNASSQASATPVVVLDGVANTANFALVPGGSISGRVLRPDGTPLPGGGNLMVSPASDRGFKDVYPINTDGTFAVSGLGPGSYVLSAVADGTLVTYYGTATSSPVDSAAATPVDLAKGGTVTGLSIRLAAGASVSGRVTEGSVGASTGQVSVIDINTGAQLGSATLSGTGSYTVAGLPTGTYAVLATGSTGATRWFGNTTTWADSTFVSLAGATARTGVDIALPAVGPGPAPTSTVSGRITLPPGAATTDFNNLSVSLEDAAGQSYSTFSVNADGTFDIFDVPAGSLTVHLLDFTQELVLPAQTVTAPTTTLAVAPVVGGSIAGSLVNEAGKPLANVDVTAMYASGVTSSTLSGADGTFRISGLLAGDVRLHLGPVMPYAGTWVGGSQTAGSGTVNAITLGTTTAAGQITVPLGGTIAGTVTAPAAAQGTEITVEALDAGNHVVGSTSVIGTHGYELGGLLPGVVRVRFSGSGLATQLWSSGGGSPSNVTVVAGRTVTGVNATLAAPPTGSASVAGTITAQANPVARATVSIVRTSDGQAAGTASSDSTGSYVVSGLAAGDYRIEVDACLTNGGGGARVGGPLCVASTPIPVTLADGAHLTGRDVELSSLHLFTTAPQPTITGTARVGVTLAVTDGTWAPVPTALNHRWIVGGVVVSTSASYTPAAADQGKAVTVETTATLAGYAARTTRSAPTAGVAPGILTAPSAVAISGTARVGMTLTAVPGTWGPLPVSLKYQWSRNGVAITGATAATYLLAATDRATTITVAVTGAKTGYTPVTKTSAATAAVATGVLSATPVPTITGTAKVGSRLTATAGTWGPLPVTLKYQWNRNGVAIPGAVASTYVLGAADRTARITVTVTGAKTAFTTVAKTSAATVAVATGTLTASPVPKITGTTRVGSRLTATAGTWSPAPVTLKYQWRRNGVAITGATASTYVVASTNRGARITVTVTGSKTGYTSVARTSTATAAIV